MSESSIPSDQKTEWEYTA